MNTLSNLFLNSLWPGLVVWGLLYISDYALTLSCARLRRAGAGDKIVVEGSYEITPFYQRDIDSLRPVSPRFVAILLLGVVTLAIFRNFAMQLQPELYYFALGALISVQLAIPCATFAQPLSLSRDHWHRWGAWPHRVLPPVNASNVIS